MVCSTKGSFQMDNIQIDRNCYWILNMSLYNFFFHGHQYDVKVCIWALNCKGLQILNLCSLLLSSSLAPAQKLSSKSSERMHKWSGASRTCWDSGLVACLCSTLSSSMSKQSPALGISLRLWMFFSSCTLCSTYIMQRNYKQAFYKFLEHSAYEAGHPRDVITARAKELMSSITAVSSK